MFHFRSMVNRISINPDLLQWAIERAGLSVNALPPGRVEPAAKWISGKTQPTLKKLQDFADAVHVPIGYLFLDKRPVEDLPVPDYRTFDDEHPNRKSPNLIDTLHEVQRRQDWMRDFLIETGAEKLPIVGSIKRQNDVEKAAEKIRTDLGLAPDWAIQCRNQEDACRSLRNIIDDFGIMISMTGYVGLNTHRALDPDEFCGFTLLDDYVPALFVNSNTPLSSQMFTIAHELVHIWCGKAGILNQVDGLHGIRLDDEKRCNAIAAEFLVPKILFSKKWSGTQEQKENFSRLANFFRVSRVVIARRALDLNLIERDDFFPFWRAEKERWKKQKTDKSKKSGGNAFQNYRVKFGKRFSEAVISATRSGFLSYGEAFRLTGLQGGTFDKYVHFLQQGGKLD